MVGCRVEEGVVSMGVAVRELRGGRSRGDYLGRAIVDCGGAPTVDTAFMGLTSCRRITIAKTLAHRPRECAIDIMPTAVSLSNAADRYTSSVMGRQRSRGIQR